MCFPVGLSWIQVEIVCWNHSDKLREPTAAAFVAGNEYRNVCECSEEEMSI